MSTSRNPAKSRPLSANVKRLMRLSRASPRNGDVVKVGWQFSIRDLAFCGKQGSLFMEAASMGFAMSDFAPLFMTSQIAGIFDVYFSTSNRMSGSSMKGSGMQSSGMQSNGTAGNELFDLIRIPMLLKSPQTVVEALYWIDDIIERAEDGQNKSLLVSRAYEEETLKLPPALADLPEEPNRNVDELAYAYWLGYIYRCECLLHEESSRMVYGAFSEEIMREAYIRLLNSPMGKRDLMDSAVDICKELDRFLVEKLWPAKKKRQRKRQAKELERNTPEKQSGEQGGL